ncbi:hypothetical protein GQ42DRAFT_161477 [Ramicandelaber brevisporus]|nr:hypothetical protein GQ42DRAFT_161477 [Ramicandelaber brevisporus]
MRATLQNLFFALVVLLALVSHVTAKRRASRSSYANSSDSDGGRPSQSQSQSQSQSPRPRRGDFNKSAPAGEGAGMNRYPSAPGNDASFNSPTTRSRSHSQRGRGRRQDTAPSAGRDHPTDKAHNFPDLINPITHPYNGPYRD